MVFMEVLKSVAEGLEMLLSQKMSSKEEGEPPTLLFELFDEYYFGHCFDPLFQDVTLLLELILPLNCSLS